MKKVLFFILVIVSTPSFAALSSNQIATCFYSDLFMAQMMKSQGNVKVANDYESTAQFWAEEGNKRLGPSNFETAWKAAASKVNKMSVDQLVSTKKQCLMLMPETLK